MPVNDSNLEQLITAARLLRPLLGELVFVGGTVTGLLITDEAAADPRPTLDVDTIAELTSYAEYQHLATGCAPWGSRKTAVKGRRYAGGFIAGQFST
jgi:hypothetical protein